MKCLMANNSMFCSVSHQCEICGSYEDKLQQLTQNSNILHVLVPCCRDVTRFEVLTKVIEQLNKEKREKSINIQKNTIVFDNCSTYPGTLELLTENFEHVYAADKNEGFWSAINWTLNNYETILGKTLTYSNVIEDDHFYFASEKFALIENFLDSHPEIGGVRTQEFVLSERHLYDKFNPCDESKKYAWVTQFDFLSGRYVTFAPTDVHGFYTTQFLSQLHSVNRIESFKKVFQQLAGWYNDSFTERDYQLLYHAEQPVFAIIDGGLQNAKLSYQYASTAGSYIKTGIPEDMKNDVVLQEQKDFGYKDTRSASITPIEQMVVTKAK